MTTIGIFIVDEQDILIDALIKLLSGQNALDLEAPYADLPYAQRVSDQYKLEFRGRAKDAKETFDRLPAMLHRIDILLLDISLKGTNDKDRDKYEGLRIGREVKQRFPKLKVAFLTQLDESYAIEEARDMKANGYISKDFGQKELTEAIIKIYSSNEFVLKVGFSIINTLRHTPVTLSDIETQIANYFLAEWTATEMAEALNINQPNVERHLRIIKGKLKVENAAGLSRELILKGLATNWEKYKKIKQ